jgi:hypothetical protein
MVLELAEIVFVDDQCSRFGRAFNSTQTICRPVVMTINFRRRGFAHDLKKKYLYPRPSKIVSMDDRALVVLSAVGALQQAWH